MQVSVNFKNLDPSDNLKSYIKDKLDRLDKLLDNPAIATVVLSVEKFRHIAEINIAGDRLNINSTEKTNNMYSAIDMLLDKVEKQIKKGKQKIRERRTGSKFRTKGIESEENITTAYEEPLNQVSVENIEYKPMDVEEAIMQMSLIKDSFLVFTNSRTDKVNVIYRRRNGQYGLIQPST